MNTMKYVFGRVISSEVNRGLAQYHKVKELQHIAADGQAALRGLSKWTQSHPDHPLITRFNEEIGRLNNDLRLTDVTRGTKISVVVQNTWRLAQEDDQAQKALAVAQAREAKAQAKTLAKARKEETKALVKARIEETKRQTPPLPGTKSKLTDPKWTWLRLIYYFIGLNMLTVVSGPDVELGPRVIALILCGMCVWLWIATTKANRARKEVSK